MHNERTHKQNYAFTHPHIHTCTYVHTQKKKTKTINNTQKTQNMCSFTPEIAETHVVRVLFCLGHGKSKRRRLSTNHNISSHHPSVGVELVIASAFKGQCFVQQILTEDNGSASLGSDFHSLEIAAIKSASVCDLFFDGHSFLLDEKAQKFNEQLSGTEREREKDERELEKDERERERDTEREREREREKEREGERGEENTQTKT